MATQTPAEREADYEARIKVLEEQLGRAQKELERLKDDWYSMGYPAPPRRF
jgi:chaperonin cofactor prefoldin